MNWRIAYKTLFYSSFLMFSLETLVAQEVDSSFHSTYYDQKTSLFKLLPKGQGEIIFLGNSITDMGEWAEIFQDQRVKNRGISGDNTFGVLNRVDEIIAAKPLKIFLMIGINDLAQKIPDERIVKNYEKIISRIQSGSPLSCIYLQSVLPTNNEFTDFPRHQGKGAHIQVLNYNLERIARERGCIYIDLYAVFVNDKGMLDKKYTNDGLHLRGPAYLLWKHILREKGYL